MAENIELLLEKAQLLEKKGNYSLLAEIYRQIAKLYHKQKNREKNAEFLQKSKEANNKIPAKKPQLNLSVDKEFDQIVALPVSTEKLERLEKFVAKHKNFTYAFFALAELYRNLEIYDKSKENFEFFIKIHDTKDKQNLASAYYNLAILANNYFKEYELAKKHYKKAIELNPNFSVAYYNLAILTNDYFKEYELAKKYFESRRFYGWSKN